MIGYIIAALSLIANFFQFMCGQKNLHENKKFEKKMDVYSSYLGKIQKIKSKLKDNLSGDVLDSLSDLLLKSTQGDTNYQDFIDSIVKGMKKSSLSLIEIRNELLELRLICSKEILELIDEQEQNYKEYEASYENMLSNIAQIAEGDIDLQNLVTEEDRRIFEKINSVNEKIEAQMRLEIHGKEK